MDRPKNLLAKLGLHRREIRAWAMYDLAELRVQPSTIITAIFPVYFTSVAGADLAPGEATRLLARTTTIALATSAILAPFLGALADYAPIKKRLLGLFMAIGCIAAGCLALVTRGDWFLAAVCFGIGNIGFTASLTFYDSLLPHIAREDEIDRVSTGGYALGYLGGGVLLALNVAWILSPATFGLRDAAQASRLSFAHEIPLNLLPEGGTADYIDTGIWSQKAIEEASRYGHVNVAATAKPYDYFAIPGQNEWKLSKDAAYVHYAPNETIGGLEFHWIPEIGDVPLVADMSSDILSRPVDSRVSA